MVQFLQDFGAETFFFVNTVCISPAIQIEEQILFTAGNYEGLVSKLRNSGGIVLHFYGPQSKGDNVLGSIHPPYV